MADAIRGDEGHGEDAVRMLQALEGLGLVGPRLAVSAGTEETLARQLAEHLGIPFKRWQVDFVKGQVESARQMEDLENRLQGTVASVPQQRMMDAAWAQAKELEELHKAELEEAAAAPIIPRRGTLGKSVRLRTGRVVTEDAAEEKVLKILTKELADIGAPVLLELGNAAQPERALKSLMGKYRASTLRRYLASWQHFRKWCYMGENHQPNSPTSFIDYLFVREEEGMGASIPLAVSRAVTWFQQLAGVPEGQRLTDSQAVDLVVKDLVKKLESKAKPIKMAPRWLTMMIGPMEGLVMDRGAPLGRRVAAWMKLVKLWGALRFSDAANMKVRAIRFYDGKFTATLQKTKTTGAGKRVRELPLYIGEDAYVSESSWLEIGYNLVKRTWREDGDFVFNEGALDSGQTGTGPMKYYEASAASSDVITALRDYEGERIFPEGFERFWSEHSERSTLPSCLAAMGVSKTDRDLIGRWLPEGSDQYVRTYNAAVARLQRKFVKVVRSGKAYATFDEGSILEEMKEWMVTQWEVEPEAAGRAVEAFKKKVKVLAAAETGDDAQPSGEETELAPTDSESEEGRAAPSEGKRAKVEKKDKCKMSELGEFSKKAEERPSKERKFQLLAEERQGGYVVVYQRAGRGTLHLLGPDACWMAKKRSFTKAEIHKECPDPQLYSTWCKLCWRKEAEKAQESTSDSIDELDLSDVTDG